MAGQRRTPDGLDRLAQGLLALDARAWARLLQSLRRLDRLPEPVSAELERPTSELAAGSRRRALCRLIADTPAVLTALAADPALPTAAHELFGSDPDGSEDRGPVAGVDDGDGGDEAAERSAERLRTLRRELAEVRRQRDGAEARAGVAETRLAAAEAARTALEHRIADLEAALSSAADDVEQAVARAERRSAARNDELERILASERSALEESRRERERTVMENLRSELEDLRARPVAPVTARSAAPRPLVLPDALSDDTTAAARWLLDGVSVLLVDGYNVSLALHAGHPLSEQRRWLVERLRPLGRRGRATPVVVFDGDGEGRSQRDPSGVEVRFTASGTIADDEIVFAVAATDEPVLVITDDVELQERVRAEGGNVLGTVHLLGAIDG